MPAGLDVSDADTALPPGGSSGRTQGAFSRPGGAVTAFDPLTGETVWSSGSDEIKLSIAHPFWKRNGTEQIVAAGDAMLWGLDPG